MKKGDFMVGKSISQYKILEKIGQGGMGEVYLAQDTSLDRKVALKFLPEEMQEDPTARKRFLREAKSAAALDHPFICKIYEVGQAEGKDFISMEYVQGRTLKEKLADGPLALKDALQKATEIAEALEAAHKHDIVHRDLKPSNIMLTPEGHVKVMDFGLAKRLVPVEGIGSQEQTLTASLTKTGATLGTLAYMSPEQLRGREVDARSDIFSFGIVLCEMLTGTDPFKRSEPMDTASSILKEDPPPLYRYMNEVPPLLEHTVKKMLAKKADQRYQSVHEVRTNLDELSHQAAAVPRGEWKVVPEQKGLRWTVLLVVAVIFIALVGWWLFRGGTPSIAPGEITSIAVLPLDNFMRDPEQDYFVEGMHEALITELSKIGALRVISRTSAVRYKESDKSLPEIAQELNVDALVEGSVLRSEATVRITAQLIALEPERHVWAENYQRELRDVLALQSEIARAIAEQIRIAVTPEEQRRLASSRPVNPKAYDAYAKGQFHWNKWTPQDLQKSLEYFQRATDIDPSFASAWEGLSRAYRYPVVMGIRPGREFLPKAKEAALRAVKLDDTSAEAHAALGAGKCLEWNSWLECEQEFQRALKLNPKYALGHHMYAITCLTPQGRLDEALEHMQRAVELEPTVLIHHVVLGHIFYYRGEYEQSIQQLHEALDLDRNFATAYLFLSWGYREKGMYENAIEAIQKAVELGVTHRALGQLGYTYAVADQRMEARKILEGMLRRARSGYVPPLSIAVIYAGLGETDRAFEWLEKAYQQRDSRLTWAKVLPHFNRLRDDPRFTELLGRIGLDPS